MSNISHTPCSKGKTKELLCACEKMHSARIAVAASHVQLICTANFMNCACMCMPHAQHIGPGQHSTLLISKPCYVEFKYTVDLPHTQHIRPAPKHTPFKPKKHAQVLRLPLFTSLAALRAVVALARSPAHPAPESGPSRANSMTYSLLASSPASSP